MRRILIALTLIGLVSGAVMADGPRFEVVPGAVSPTYPEREDVCQYGFTDTMTGGGYLFDVGTQLGISCAIGPTTITGVGFYCEYIGTPGTCDIVILDDDVEVSRTPVQPQQGTNEFDIPDIFISGTACILISGIGDCWGVTGEDETPPISGMSFWSMASACTTVFPTLDLLIWAVHTGSVPTPQTTWGGIQNLFR